MPEFSITEKANVAIVGINGAVGEAILALLEERHFPLGKIFLLDFEQSAGNRLQFRDKYHIVSPLETFDFAQVQLAFFAINEETVAEYVARAAACACVVIDNSPCFRNDDEVPLVVPEVNSQALADFRNRGIIASPAPVTTMMLLALKPIHDAVGILRINITTFQAVSELGKEATEELASQTVALLSMQQPKREVFPAQIAFNVLGQIGELEGNGYSREEMRMMTESQKILRDRDIVINATATRVPVFFGHSAAIHLETREKLTATAARKLLQNCSSINVMDGSPDDLGSRSFPTVVDDVAGSDDVFVGRIREDLSHPRGLNLWVVADGVHRCMALNSVQIAEFLVKETL